MLFKRKIGPIMGGLAVASAFALCCPLADGCRTEPENHMGVVMAEKKATLAEGYVISDDKVKYVDGLTSSNSFAVCRRFLKDVMGSKSIGNEDKWRAILSVAKKYRSETLDYAIEIIRDKKYLKGSTRDLSEGEYAAAKLMSQLIAYDSGHLRLYAEYVSSVSQSSISMLGGRRDVPVIAGFFSNALIFRKNIPGEDDAFKLAEEIMKDNVKYSALVNALAASAMIEMDPVSAAKSINRERKLTPNPVKSELLKSVLEEWSEMIPNRK